jgi:hypothetical protein
VADLPTNSTTMITVFWLTHNNKIMIWLWRIEWVSVWVLLSANGKCLQIYHDKNKLHIRWDDINVRFVGLNASLLKQQFAGRHNSPL